MEFGVVCVHVCVWAGKVARASSSSVHACMRVPVGRLLRGILLVPRCGHSGAIDGPPSATASTALTLLGVAHPRARAQVTRRWQGGLKDCLRHKSWLGWAGPEGV